MNSYKRPTVIGHGSYGYIFCPPLICDDGTDASNNETNQHCDFTFNIENNPSNMRVSKLMFEDEATQEFLKYHLFQRADPDHQFHLGNVEMAIPSYKNTMFLALMPNGSKIVQDLTKYRMILMNHGGISIRNYVIKTRCHVMNGAYNRDTKRELIAFWQDTWRLVQGVRKMLDAHIIHHDIKPANVVYDVSHNRLNLIDFGLVNTMEKIHQKAMTSSYSFAIFFYNMPHETFFYDKSRFAEWLRYTPLERESRMQSFFTSWKRHAKPDLYPYTDVDSDEDEEYSFTDSLHFIHKELKHLKEFEKDVSKWDSFTPLLTTIQTDFIHFLVHDVDKYPDFDTFMQASLSTVDLYGLGYTLLFCLVNTYHLLPIRFISHMYALIRSMIDGNLCQRITIDALMKHYTQVLQQLVPTNVGTGSATWTETGTTVYSKIHAINGTS